MSKTNKKILKEKHLNTILLESYKQEKTEFQGSPVIASFNINVTTENLPNYNGRLYPSSVWNQPYSFKKGGKYLDENGRLKPLSLLGNLDHPKDDDGEVYLEEAGLIWAELNKDGDNWDGKAHVLDTPKGRIIKTFLEYAKIYGGGEQIGVSTRALGDSMIVESAGETVEEILPEGFELVSIDFVYNPSSIYANEPLLESRKRRTTLVESIKKLKEADKNDHKEVYDKVLNDLQEEEEEDYTLLLENKAKIKFAYAVVEFIEGGPTYDTPSQAKLRDAKNKQTQFTDLDKLGDLMNKADIEYADVGYDKCYIDFYGTYNDTTRKILHIRWDLGDKIGRDEYPSNDSIDEIEEVMLRKVWGTYTTLIENRYVKAETTSIKKAKEEYIKTLKDTEHKLYNAIYKIDNMSDEEYQSTKYYIDTPDKENFLTKLRSEYDSVSAEIKGLESLKESTGYESWKYARKYDIDVSKEIAWIYISDIMITSKDVGFSVGVLTAPISKGGIGISVYRNILDVDTKEDALNIVLGELEKLGYDTSDATVDYHIVYDDKVRENKGGKDMDKDKDKVLKEKDEQGQDEKDLEKDKDKDLEDEKGKDGADDKGADDKEKDKDDDSGDDKDKEEDKDKDEEKDFSDLTDTEKLDTLYDLVTDVLLKLDELFAPLEPLEDFDDEFGDDFDTETDFTDEDIDNMTEEELLGLEELLDLEED